MAGVGSLGGRGEVKSHLHHIRACAAARRLTPPSLRLLFRKMGVNGYLSHGVIETQQ